MHLILEGEGDYQLYIFVPVAQGGPHVHFFSFQTAQLQLAKQNVQDQPGVEAHTQEVQELKHK